MPALIEKLLHGSITAMEQGLAAIRRNAYV